MSQVRFTLLIAGISSLCWCFSVAFAAVALPTPAQHYPSKPIRLVLPYLGGADPVGRWLAQRLSLSIGQQVVPDPRLGAGGNIGHEVVAKSLPDGYTLLMAATPLVINPNLNPKVNYDSLRDFAPIVLIGTIPSVLVVHPSVPAKSLRELVQLARSEPGKLSYGAGGVGSTSHLAVELLKSLAKIDMVLVQYKGATFALIGAMTGEVGVVIGAASAVAPYVTSGRMRALALLDAKRIPSLPGVQTSAEAGMPQLLVSNWYALLAPAGTPRAIIDLLNTESVKIMHSAETRERFTAIGAEPAATTPEQCAEFLREEYARWGNVIRNAGVKLE